MNQEEARWTEHDVQVLVQRPDRLLDHGFWRQQIQEAGGLKALYGRLLALPLKEKQRTMLETLITYPGASVDSYCSMLHIHQATFHRHQRALFQSLATFLNSQQAASAEPLGPALRSLHQLPAPVGDFIGRIDEIAFLITAIRSARDTGTPSILACIHGMGGVGKTELAFAVAQRLIDHFPDAQLVVPLHGSRDSALTPVQALQNIVRAFGQHQQLPHDLDELQQAYRSCLHGKRVLIVADDARDADHVRQLLPPANCALLITSRVRFALPAMVQLHLEGLTAERSSALLRSISPRANAAEAFAIASACGHLPLAIRASGSILANNPALPIANYIQRLADTRQRLTLLRDPDDPQLDVEASLDLSFAHLPSHTQHILLQLAPLVADFSSSFAAAVTEPLPSAPAMDDELYLLLRRNLLIFDSHRERWRLHDLVRGLALKKLPSDLADAVAWRYARTTLALLTDIRIRSLQGGQSAVQALRDFDRERPHIDALWSFALANQTTPAGDQLLIDALLTPQGVNNIRYSYRDELLPRFMLAIDAARRIADTKAEGELEWRRGVIELGLGNLDACIAAYERGLTLVTPSGDQRMITHIQSDLAATYLFRGGCEAVKRGLALYQQILATYEKLGAESNPVSICLNNIGNGYMLLKDYAQAQHYCQQALAIAEQRQDPMDQCRALATLGEIYALTHAYERSLQANQRALDLARQVGHVQAEAVVSGYLAKSLVLCGQDERGFALFEEALAQIRAINDRWYESRLTWEYGKLLLSHGSRERGLELLRASIAYKAEINAGSLAQDRAVLAALEAGLPLDEALSSV